MSPARPWTPFAVMLGAALILAPCAAWAQSNRLVINRGATQQATVTLAPDSNVSIDAVTGDVVVNCAASTVNPALCADPVGGTGTPPPAFTIAASQFTNPATDGVYPPLTQFRVAPVGLGAPYEACQRIANAPNTNWTGLVAVGDATVNTVVLPNASTSYNFSLRCFAPTGALTSNVVTVASGAGSVPTPGNCPAGDVWTGQPWVNFTRNAERRFTDLRLLTGGLASEFPQLGGLAVWGASVNQYVSVQFTAPAQGGTMFWGEAQGGGAGPADVGNVYFSITRCPGDFRLPPANNIPDPDEPTLNLGCRNILLVAGVRSIRASIGYSINTPPNNGECSLAQGQPYYMNFITVNPLDGYQPNEHNCANLSPRCGVQMQSN